MQICHGVNVLCVMYIDLSYCKLISIASTISYFTLQYTHGYAPINVLFWTEVGFAKAERQISLPGDN